MQLSIMREYSLVYLWHQDDLGLDRALFVLLKDVAILSDIDLCLYSPAKEDIPLSMLRITLFYRCTWCILLALSLWCAALRTTLIFIYFIIVLLWHFCAFVAMFLSCLKLFPVKQCVKSYSHTQQVVVLLDSSPTGTLPTPVVIVIGAQPQDIAFFCSQFLRVLCVM